MNGTKPRELRDLKDIYNGSYDAYYNSGTGMFKLLGSADLMKEDVIGVFFKQIPIFRNISAYHMYILCHDHRAQMQFIFRAGPSMNVEPIHAAVYFITGAAPPVKPEFVTFGYLKGEVGLNRPYELITDKLNPSVKIVVGSADYDATNSNIGVIVKKGNDLRKVFDRFKDIDIMINRLSIRYNPLYPNSNSYVTTLLKRAELPSAKEAIDSYGVRTPNREYFTNLFTPGAAVIDITRAGVAYDSRDARELTRRFGPLASDADSTEVGPQLSTDNSIINSWPRDKYFYSEGEYTLREKMNREIKQAGTKNVYIPDVSFQ